MSARKVFNIIVIAVFFVILAIFIAQNNQAVSIRFMKWSYDSQSGLIVLFSFLAGIFVALLICLVSSLFRKKPKQPQQVTTPPQPEVKTAEPFGKEPETPAPEKEKPDTGNDQPET